ncbi:hypothetical protein FRC11_000941, partial [Ceratobasidium sp. 423]
MPVSLNNGIHPHLGRHIPQYFDSYTNEAIAAPVVPSQETQLRVNAIKTINNLILLGRLQEGTMGELLNQVTLPLLLSVLELIKLPNEVKRLAEPKLVAGCVELMVSVEHPFAYEYGYVCFRILNLALNACILKHTGNLNNTVTRLSLAPVAEANSIFWSESAEQVLLDLIREGEIGRALCLEITGSVLNRLLDTLHVNQKEFFIVSRDIRSMGLSGLMLILRVLFQLQGVGMPMPVRVAMSNRLVQPYSRVLWRYLLVVPGFIDNEPQAIFQVHLQITSLAKFKDKHFIDVEDSRNLLQALNERLDRSPWIQFAEAVILLRFVEPLVVPGCEDLLPTLVERSIRIMWNSITKVEKEDAEPLTILGGYLLCFRDIFRVLKPRSFTHQPWIVSLVGYFIEGDLLELILRVAVTAPDFIPIRRGPAEMLTVASVEVFEGLVELAPNPYVVQRLRSSDRFSDWFKYHDYFYDTADAFEEAQPHPGVLMACGAI